MTSKLRIQRKILKLWDINTELQDTNSELQYNLAILRRLELWDINLRTLWEKSQNCEIKRHNYVFYFLFHSRKKIVRCKFGIARKKIRILSLYRTILIFFSCNFEFLFQNSDFSSQNCNLQNILQFYHIAKKTVSK